MDHNDLLRFLLELIGLVAYGYWGYVQGAGLLGLAPALGLPLLVVTVWGVFRVPGDPGTAPVAIPGLLRLLLEAVVFGLAVVAFVDAGWLLVGAAFGLAVLAHYALARERVERLIVGE